MNEFEQAILASKKVYIHSSIRRLCSGEFTTAGMNVINVFNLVAMEGLLSPNEGRKGHRIYLWHGSRDSVVPSINAINSYNFLRQLLPPSASIYLDNKVPANHGLSSLHRGSTKCGERENLESFVERCNVSTVHRMLNHLFGPQQQGQESQKDQPENSRGNCFFILEAFLSQSCKQNELSTIDLELQLKISLKNSQLNFHS